MRVLCREPRSRLRAGAAGRASGWVPAPWPARAHAERRRGAAAEARRVPRAVPNAAAKNGGHARSFSTSRRRACTSTTLPCSSALSAGSIAAGHSVAGDRAQPRRDPGRGLDHRPGPGGRRGRGKGRVRGHAAAGRRVPRRATQGAALRAAGAAAQGRAARRQPRNVGRRRRAPGDHERRQRDRHPPRARAQPEEHRPLHSRGTSFSVITGVSGSGKSTVAFDILFAEGQRRYLESLNAYARQFVQPAKRPDVDGVYGVPPTVAIEQRTSRGGRKSTVATLTEIYPFLRLLFVKLGTQYCPDCNVPIEPQSTEAILARILADFRGSASGSLRPLSRPARATTRILRPGPRQKGSSTSVWTAPFFQPCHGPAWIVSSSTPSSCPLAEIRSGRSGKGRCGNPSSAGWTSARAWCAHQRNRFFHAQGLPQMREELRGAGPAAFLLQLEARLVPLLLRHGASALRLRL